MIQINNKPWNNLVFSDIEKVLGQENESIHFEWKDEGVSADKIAKEISAFANTYGGYLFIGVDDKGGILGNKEWDEQRIHNIVHNKIFPLPVFSVKSISSNEGVSVLVVRIEEGSEPPYITDKGVLYERVSSGSFPIKNADGLTRLYQKRRDNTERLEKKIIIPPIVESINNMFAYIDMGFVPYFSNKEEVVETLLDLRPEDVLRSSEYRDSIENIVRVGSSLLITAKAVDSDEPLPAHANNFMGIMHDGSVRLRLLIINNDGEPYINMSVYSAVNSVFESVYKDIMGKTIDEDFLYAKKYIDMKVLKQFHPAFYYDDYTLESHPEYCEINEKLLDAIIQQREETGIDRVITDERIPASGLYQIDKELISAESDGGSVVEHLFYCPFIWTGFSERQQMLMDSYSKSKGKECVT